MRFDVYEVARDGAPPHYKPSRTQAVLADAALWQAAGFIAAYIARRSAEDVRSELRRFTGMDEIWGPGIDACPTTAGCSPPMTVVRCASTPWTRRAAGSAAGRTATRPPICARPRATSTTGRAPG
jgi:hypothetical protein